MRKFLLITLLCCSAIAAAQPAAPEVRVTPAEVRVEPVAAGGTVLLVGVTIGEGPRLRGYTEVLRDEDSDGRVAFRPDELLPFRSLFFGVEVESGRLGIGTPEGFRVRRLSFPLTASKKDTNGAVTGFIQERQFVEMLIVRPGAGAWILVAGEGAAGDGDREDNGKLHLDVSDAKPLTRNAGDAPKHLKKGDIVVLVDLTRLDVFTTQVD